MCIIIYKPPGVCLKKEVYESCFENNPDGAGFIIYDKDVGLTLKKGFFKFKSFWEEFSPYQSKKAVVHFRVKTHGNLGAENTHPFWIAENEIAFAHNGIINESGEDTTKSDTWHFNTQVLQELYNRAGPDFIKDDFIKKLLMGYIGGWNKLVFINKEGEVWIFNKNSGESEFGAWFSNDTYKRKWVNIPWEEKQQHSNKNEKWDGAAGKWIPKPKEEKKRRDIIPFEKRKGWDTYFNKGNEKEHHSKECCCRDCRVKSGNIRGKLMQSGDQVVLTSMYLNLEVGAIGEVLSFNQNGTVNILFFLPDNRKDYKACVPVYFIDQVLAEQDSNQDVFNGEQRLN